MAPKRKRAAKITRSETEQSICKKKLDALEQEETQSKDDRFTVSEKRRLLEAYNKRGFQVFQNTELLQEYFPTRTASDLTGLMARLKVGLGSLNNQEEDKLSEWQILCTNLMGNFARDKRVNIDDAFSDALALIASKWQSCDTNEESSDETKPDYPELLRSFSQLLAGKFPDNMTKANAQVSMKLFEHINGLVDSSELLLDPSLLESGSWLKEATSRRRQKLDEAKTIFEESSDEPTIDEHNCSLFLELPKLRRIQEFLNPLRLDPYVVERV